MRLMKGKLRRKIMTKFVALRSKSCTYLINNDSEDKKAKDIKRCVIKRQLKSQSYSYYLEATQLRKKINHPEKNKMNKDSLKNS